MGKFTQAIDTGALRAGNTIATPLRRGGELGNGLANIPRQGYSSTKNIAEVSKQTLNALANNFLNFSKVQGKWYQKMIKVPINAVSACTRRPLMIAGAGVASSLNQGLRQPFKKLLYTPKTMFNGIKNATRIFSKRKGFDFQNYTTHETGNIWMTDHTNLGFLGTTSGSSSTETSKTPDKPKKEAKKEEPKPESKKEEVKEEVKEESKKTEAPKEQTKEVALERGSKARIDKMEAEKNDKAVDEYLDPPGEKFGSGKVATNTKPKSIKELQQKAIQETQEKEKKEQSENFPAWKTLDPKFKAEHKKEYDKVLKNNLTKDGIIARGKEAKLGDTPEEIIKNFKEKDPTFVGYLQEILSKSA